MGITFKELIKNHNVNDIPLSHQLNLEDLLRKMNKVRVVYNQPMSITSGYRSEQDHLRIYAAKGITDRKLIPMHSMHLYGNACDVYDPCGEVKAWILLNMPLMEDIGLWFEDFGSSSSWVHFQQCPPHSGNRIFKP